MEQKPISDDNFLSGIINDANYIEADEEESELYEEYAIFPPDLMTEMR
jgi:hypothetical protein